MECVNSLKQASLENPNPVVSDSHWNRFRRWFNSESQKLKELSYELAQQNFCDQLNAFKDQVLSHWERKSILQLDNASWKEH